VEASVDLIEDLGADLLIHCRLGDLKLVARAGRNNGITTDMATSLFFPVDKLHLFIDQRRVDSPIAPPA
jgi:ABC-type sugar transport system ATPase subunit